MAKNVIEGVRLNGQRVCSKRPVEEAKKRLYSLAKDRGFPLGELARDFGLSEDTLRKYARRYNCLRYVEVGPGDWVQCVLHPDTAAKHGEA